jgi:hypothetical protein
MTMDESLICSLTRHTSDLWTTLFTFPRKNSPQNKTAENKKRKIIEMTKTENV